MNKVSKFATKKKPTNKQIVEAWGKLKNPRKVAAELGTETHLVLRALYAEGVDINYTGKGVQKRAA